MNAEQKAEWLEVKARGMGRYIFVEGIVNHGGIFALLLLITTYFFKYGYTSSKVFEYLWNGETIFKFFFGLIFFGLWMGLFNWYFNEREFRKPEKNKT